MENNKSPNKIKIINDKNIDNNIVIKTRIAFIYDLSIKINDPKMTISDLKEQISKNYSIQENEYELLIGEKSINNIPNSTHILEVLNKYKDNKIKIKSFKNIFDIKKQLTFYDDFLSKNILLKDNDIKLLNSEHEKIKEDLKNI